MGAAVRQVRGGLGRALARARWNARRARALRAKRRRMNVVGFVRLVGKGPPPMPGPVMPSRLRGICSSREPLDSAMLDMIEACVEIDVAAAERWEFQSLAHAAGLAH